MQEMAHAMTKIRGEAERLTEKYVWDFYTRGNPKVYERTYMLPNSADTTPLVYSGNAILFKTGYDENKVSWNTRGFNSTEVMWATEYGEAGVLGKSGYFKSLEGDIEPLINNSFRSMGFK